jgi:transcriptional regulator with XRE-family HTH domain
MPRAKPHLSIQEIIKMRRISQSELAIRANTTGAMVSYLHSGNRRPSVDLLFSIAKAVDADVILGVDGTTRFIPR